MNALKVLRSIKDVRMFKDKELPIKVDSETIFNGFVNNKHLLELINTNSFFGTSDMIETLEAKNLFIINPEKVAFRMSNIRLINTPSTGNSILADIDILNTEFGKILNEHFDMMKFIPRMAFGRDGKPYLITFDYRFLNTIKGV